MYYISSSSSHFTLAHNPRSVLLFDPPGTRTYGPVLRRFYDVILAFLRPFAKAAVDA